MMRRISQIYSITDYLLQETVTNNHRFNSETCAISQKRSFIFSTYANLIVSYRPTAASEETCPDENVSEAGTTHTELSILEKDCCKQNFQFYDKAKQGFVERFELPLVLESK